MGMSKLIDRIQYRALKKYTFEQMVDFITTLYIEGYKTATKDIAKTIKTIDENKLEKEIKELMRKEFGIGEKRYSNADMERKFLEAITACTSESEVSEVEVSLTDKREVS
jgi:hypothetical protein